MLWRAWIRSLGMTRYLYRCVMDGLCQGAFVYLVVHEFELIRGSHSDHGLFFSVSGCVIWLLLHGVFFLFRGMATWPSDEPEQQPTSIERRRA